MLIQYNTAELRLLTPGFMQDATHETLLNNKRFVKTHCATRRKVESSIPDRLLRISHCLNPSDCTVAQSSSQPLTETGTRGI
jgi:hypothetical protein